MTADEVAANIGHGTERRSGTGWSIKCPAHEDSTPSLSVSEGRDGKVLVHCHAGCTLDDVLAATRLDRSDLSPKREDAGGEDWSPAGAIIARYRYTDVTGKLLFEVVRSERKRFLQRRPDPTRRGGWDWRLGDVERPLYRLPELIEAIHAGKTIFVCEGEKDVETIRRSGAVATCNPHGAGKWRSEHTETLRDADVVVIADRDEPGYRHARAVAAALRGVAQRVRQVEPVEGKDVSDHLGAGHTLEELVRLDADEPTRRIVYEIHAFLAGTDEYDWVIEGLIERGDRLMLTGFEGLGKSELIRQLVICAAAGIHPFRFRPVPAVRVLMLDFENSERQNRRRLRPLFERAKTAGHAVPKDSLYVMSAPGGIDLMTGDDRAWLIEQGRAFRPDIAFVGPHYYLHREDPSSEPAARIVAGVLDDLRTETGCALVIEAHAAKGADTVTRNVRPIGSSLWLRWPEFGYGLAPVAETRRGTPVAFKAWRGPRDERNWPDSLDHGPVWPWEGRWTDGKDQTL